MAKRRNFNFPIQRRMQAAQQRVCRLVAPCSTFSPQVYKYNTRVRHTSFRLIYIRHTVR